MSSQAQSSSNLTEITDDTVLYSRLAKSASDHKYAHGHALILSGGVGKGGAARLSGRAALRIGAGLVTLACPPSALQENAAQLNAIMTTPLKDAGHLSEVLQDDRINAICLGPGLGRTRAEEMMPTALKARRKTVIDADALTAFEKEPDAFFEMLHDQCVLTPHAGEFQRLFPDLSLVLKETAQTGSELSEVDAKIQATRDAATRAGCTVLLKGADTIIADPTGRCAISRARGDKSAPWLATAGSGDVLAGFIAGLLARGLETVTACETAARIHVECALEFGPGLIAEDLPEMLPAVLKRHGC